AAAGRRRPALPPPAARERRPAGRRRPPPGAAGARRLANPGLASAAGAAPAAPGRPGGDGGRVHPGRSRLAGPQAAGGLLVRVLNGTPPVAERNRRLAALEPVRT